MNVLQENNLIEERNFSFFVNKYQYIGAANSSIIIDASVLQENLGVLKIERYSKVVHK